MSGLASTLRRRGQHPTFLRSVGTLMGGNAVATVIPIVAAPLLGRLYTPTDYGTLAQYMAPAAVLGVIACLQFPHAIIAERSDRGAGAVAWLSFFAALMISVATAFGVAALWTAVFSGSPPGAWFALLPLSVAGAGFVSTGQFLANRYQMYHRIAFVQVGNILATVTLSIYLGLAKWGANGLLAAYFLGQAVMISAYAAVLWQLRGKLGWPTGKMMWLRLRRHWRFAAFTLPSELSSQLTLQIPIFGLSAFGNSTELGGFTRARQLVSMPLSVIGSAISVPFRMEVSKSLNKTGSFKIVFRNTLRLLILIGAPICATLIIFGEDIFIFYLGSNWQIAGEISAKLAPLAFLRFIISPLSVILLISGRQRLDFYFNLAFLGANLTLFGIIELTRMVHYLDAYIILNIAIHFVYLAALLMISNKKV